MLSLPPLPVDVESISPTDLERLREAGEHVPLSVGCITCGGTGKFRWWDENDQPADYECCCREQNKAHAFFLNAGLGRQYQRLSWRDLRTLPDGVYQQVFEYGANIDYHVAVGTNLVLWSPSRGTGKTMLAALLLKMLLVRGVDGYFTRFREAMDDKTETYGAHQTTEARAWFNRRIRNVRVLVLDDIGQERKVVRTRDGGSYERTSDYAGRLLEEVVRARDAAAIPTIITTNMTPEMLYEYDDGVMSLLARNTIEIEVGGADYRKSADWRERQLVMAREHMVPPVVW